MLAPQSLALCLYDIQQMIKCLNCKVEFDESNAYCENWLEPNKKLGCPDCHTFHLKVDKKFKLTNVLELVIFALSCFGSVTAFMDSEIKIGLYFGIIFMANGILILKRSSSKFDKVKLADS